MTELWYSAVYSPNDHMWITGLQWYFEVGKSAINCIKCALATPHSAPTSILVFRAGTDGLPHTQSLVPQRLFDALAMV